MKQTDKMTGSEKAAIPVSEKYMLTIKEASEYFNIGIKNMRRLAKENNGSYAIFTGNRYLIVRTKFEEYIDSLTNRKEDAEL